MNILVVRTSSNEPLGVIANITDERDFLDKLKELCIGSVEGPIDRDSCSVSVLHSESGFEFELDNVRYESLDYDVQIDKNVIGMTFHPIEIY